MPSTAIEHVGYDEAARELHVTFVGGGAYTYYQVPKQVYSAFRAAFSRASGVSIRDRTIRTSFTICVEDRHDFRRGRA